MVISYNIIVRRFLMHVELGTGQKNIAYYNADKQQEIDLMFLRIAAAYATMLRLKYPEIERLNRNYTMIFSSESTIGDALIVKVTGRSCGIYVSENAYCKQMSNALHRLTGLPVKADKHAQTVEIGIGGMDAESEGYVLLKDALLELPSVVFS